MVDTDNVKGGYCSKQEMIFYLNAVEEVKRLREVAYRKDMQVGERDREVKRLRKQLEDCKRQIQFTADWIRDRGEGTHAKELGEFLEWME